VHFLVRLCLRVKSTHRPTLHGEPTSEPSGKTPSVWLKKGKGSEAETQW